MKYQRLQYLTLLFSILFLVFSCQRHKEDDTQKKLEQIFKIREKGYSNYDDAKYDSSFYYFNQVKNEAEKIKDTSRIIQSLSFLAQIQHKQGDFNGCEYTCLEALKVLGNSKNYPYGETNLYISLGNNYVSTYDFETAIQCYKKAINYKTDTLIKAGILHNIALVDIVEKRYEKAKKMLEPLLEKKEVQADSLTYAIIEANLGFIYFKLQKKKALELLLASLKTKIKLKTNQDLSVNYRYLSFYFEKTNPKKSKEYAFLGLEFERKIKSPAGELEFLDLLIKKSSGDELKKYATKYIEINDSLKIANQKAKNIFAKIQYDSQREKDDNLRLKNESIKQLRKRNIIVILTIAGMSLIGFFILKKVRRKSKKEKVNVAYTTEVRLSQKLHDELANDVYQTIAFAEGQDLTSAKNKEILLSNLETIYNRTRNISRENSSIETELNYLQNLKELFFDFNSKGQHVITQGIDTINWTKVENYTKISIYRIVQELMVNMKKHSNCSVAVFTFESTSSMLLLAYSDNGLGLQNKPFQLKNGLTNLEDRIKNVDGTVIFDTTTTNGFKVKFQIPL